MVYLIESAAYKKEYNKTNLFLMFKIGYVADDKNEKRYQDILTQNPTCKILYSIPNATVEHESKIQKLFNSLIIPKEILQEVNTKEWFWHSNIIIEFFEDIKNVKELEDKLKSFPKPEKILEKNTISELLELREKLKKLKNHEYKKEKINHEKITKRLSKEYNLIDIKDITDLLEIEDPGITNSMIEYLNLSDEEINFLDQFEKINNVEKGLDLLYSKTIKPNNLENILYFLPDNYTSHYYLIGKRKLINDNPNIINEEYEKKKQLEKELNNNIIIGNSYKEEELLEIYKKCFYKVMNKKPNNYSINNLKEFFSFIKQKDETIKIL